MLTLVLTAWAAERMQRFRRAISAALVVGTVACLPTTVAGASVRTPSLSSLMVPPPLGFHETRSDEISEVPVGDPGYDAKSGSLNFDQAMSVACNGVSLTLHRRQWLGSELRVYTSASHLSSLVACVTRLTSATTTATTIGGISARYAIQARSYASQGAGGPLTVSGIPHATGLWLDAGAWDWEQVNYAVGRYLVYVAGSVPAGAKFASLLARQQYARLR